MLRKRIDKILGAFLVFVMAVLVIDVLWQVISRYLLTNPSSYTDELAGYLLIWVGLLGAAYTAGQNEHLAIDIWLHKSGPKGKKALGMVISGVVFLFALVVFFIGGLNLVYTRFLLEVTSASMEINMGYVYLVAPLSGLLIMYYSGDDFIRTLRSKPTNIESPQNC